MTVAKENASREALKLVSSRTKIIGLGTGSTAKFFIKFLGQKAAEEKLKVKCVATSKASEQLAVEGGLQVVSLAELNGKPIDLAVDGADWVDGELNLIKGYGGALAREKVVAYAAKKFVVIADESKIVPVLRGKVPLEVLEFAVPQVMLALESLGVKSALRLDGDGKVFLTDNGNPVLDAVFDEILLARDLEQDLKLIPGVVECGIFSHNVSIVIIGSEKGARILEKQ